MTPLELGGLVFALVLLLMVIGMPVAFAFLGANLLGAFLLMGGWPGWLQLVDNATALITSFTLVAVPMFVLMGALLFHSGLALRVFDALDALFGRIPARLLSDGGRRCDLFDADRFDDGQHRHARFTDGPGDDPPRLCTVTWPSARLSAPVDWPC